MTDEATLSRAELLASKFAAHRQLARWGKHRASLRPRQREQRTALVRAVRILEDPRFGTASSCVRRATSSQPGA
jgi:hypothetical protein